MRVLAQGCTVTVCYSADLSSFGTEEENLEKDRQGCKQGLRLSVSHGVLLLGGSGCVVGSGVVSVRRRSEKGGMSCHRNPDSRVAPTSEGHSKLRRHSPDLPPSSQFLGEGVSYFSAESMLMKYKSSFPCLLPGLPLLPICALTDGWATEAAENQNKRGGCWDLGGGVGGTPVQFYEARL